MGITVGYRSETEPIEFEVNLCIFEVRVIQNVIPCKGHQVTGKHDAVLSEPVAYLDSCKQILPKLVLTAHGRY